MSPVSAVIALWLIMMLLKTTGIIWPYYVQHPWIVAGILFLVASVFSYRRN